MTCAILSELYVNRYERFIDSLKKQNVEGYSEVHHIVPHSIGGTNITDEYREKIKNKSKMQWQKVKELGHSGKLHSIKG
jgi:hypothetical protein